MLHCLNRATLFKQACCLSCLGQRVREDGTSKVFQEVLADLKTCYIDVHVGVECDITIFDKNADLMLISISKLFSCCILVGI